MIKKFKPIIIIWFSCILYWQYIFLGIGNKEEKILTVGWLISRGEFIDTFNHMLSFPYLLTAFINYIGVNSFIGFRVTFWLLTLLLWVFLYLRFKLIINQNIILLTILIHAIIIPTYVGNFWGPENISSYFFVVLLFYVLALPNLNLSWKDYIIVCVCFLIIITSIETISLSLLCFIIYYLYVNRKNFKSKYQASYSILLIVPFIFLLTIYFLQDWDKGSQFVNISYTLTANTTIQLIIITFNLLFIFYLLKKKRLALATIIFIQLFLLRVRLNEYSNPLYLLTSIVFLSHVLYNCISYFWISKNITSYKNKLYVYLRLMISLVLMMLVVMLGVKASEATYILESSTSKVQENPYLKYISTLTNNNDRIWSNLRDNSIYFVSNRMPASTYYLDQEKNNNETYNWELVKQLEVFKPKIILYESGLDNLPEEKDNVLNKYLSENYIILDPKKEIEKNVFLRKNDIDNLLDELVKNNLWTDTSMEQTNASSIVGEIIEGSEIKQTFMFMRNNVYRIDLSLATYSRNNKGKINFLFTGEHEEIIYNKTFRMEDLKDNMGLSLEFQPLTNSNNKIYKLKITSDGMIGNAVTLYCSNEDQYSNGDLKINGVLQRGDLTFRAFTR